jgi:two-component system, OmpR family, sensor histidine kinase QseC
MEHMTTPQVQLGKAQDRSLWRYLWAWALGAVVALWMLLAGLAYSTGYHEAEEISDGLLVSAAQLLLSQPLDVPLSAAGTPKPPTVHPAELPAALSQHPLNAYAPEFHVLMWQGERLVWDSHGVQAQLPPRLALGHQTLGLTLQGVSQDWRVFVAESTDATVVRRVAVFMDPARREALAADISEHILLPALVFLPLVALMLASAIRRGLLPLQRLSGKIAALDVDAGQTLVPQQPYRELGVTVQSINALVLRLQAQIGRERRFAADVAHELRTPLTALVLQARRARKGSGAAEQDQALQAVEQGALRAGRILSQLLDLARAQSQTGDVSEQVDLCALALRVVSEHAALAHELGQDIALEAPEQPLVLPGQSTLLELALRNLVDNALRHNSAGTYVEVRVARDAAGQVTLSVSDDGGDVSAVRTPGSDTEPDSGTSSNVGLGIGLTLVERIAQSQGAQLVRDGGAAPFGKRFALVWPASVELSGKA